ncbi:MAG: threonine/serine exporter family protein [Anaerolineae bacterium]|nr:threonine/serine exporter family protein [Anaerolineae bacterium]
MAEAEDRLPSASEDAKKEALTRQELADIVDLSLWAGQLLMQNGAESLRIEETIHRLGTALGCDWMDIFVSSNDIAVTTISGLDFRTKIRRVVGVGVNMTIVSGVSRLSRRVERGELNRIQVRAELERIALAEHHYPRWLTILMVGLACAAFSRLFGGDWAIFGVTFVAASLALIVRQELTKRHFNAVLITVATAFVAGLLASSAIWVSASPQTALAASVLLLVPGVPLITAAEDIITGHLVVGLARGFFGTLITLAIALGLLLAVNLTGVGGL